MRFISVKEKALFQVLFQNDNRYYQKYFMNNGLLTNIIPYLKKEKTTLNEWLFLAILRKEECMPAMDTYILYIYQEMKG